MSTPSRRSRKKKEEEEVVDEDMAVDSDDDNVSTVSTRSATRRKRKQDSEESSVQSSSGGRRSSGARKSRASSAKKGTRKRSLEPVEEDEKPKKRQKKRAANGDSSDKEEKEEEEDEEMEESEAAAQEEETQEEDVEEEEAKKPAAKPTNGIPKVDRLRIPAKHTPGKLKERETRRLDEPDQVETVPRPSRMLQFGQQPPAAAPAASVKPPPKAAPAVKAPPGENGNKEEEEELPVVDRLRRTWSGVAEKGRRSFSEGVEVSQQYLAVGIETSQRYVVAGYESFQEVARDAVERLSPRHQQGQAHQAGAALNGKELLTRPIVWFGIFFLLQLLSALLIVNPYSLVVVRGSTATLGLYKRFLGSSAGIDWKDEQTRELVTGIKGHYYRLLPFHTALQARVTEIREKVIEVDDLVSQMTTKLDIAMEKARLVGEKVVGLVDSDEVSEDELAEVRALLGEKDDMLLNMSFLAEWKIPRADDCTVELDGDSGDSDALDREGVLAFVEDLKQDAAESVNYVQETDFGSTIVERLEEFVEEELPEYEKALKLASASQAGGSGTESAGLKYIRKLINMRTEIDRADQTGRIDYASMLNGAVVIRSGHYATTPSLVDTLPVSNRLFDRLALRFYGYGPEAALLPTVPTTALGQCWAFQKSPGSKYFAILSIDLARPVHIDEVVVEHPASGVTNKPTTAIRKFEVVGFEEFGTIGKSWDLGSFEYKPNESPRQSFKVTRDVKGEAVPKLRSITVAISNHWGAEYACLYRLRVLGKE